ncbi:sorting nexin-16-like isoform X2 [Argonauta hians]
MKSIADQFSPFKNRYRDSNVDPSPPYPSSVDVDGMSVYDSTVCSRTAAAASTEQFNNSDSPTPKLQSDGTVAILNSNVLKRPTTTNNNNSANSKILVGPSSDSNNTSYKNLCITRHPEISTMGQLHTSQSLQRNSSFSNDNNNNDNRNSTTSAVNDIIEKHGVDRNLPSSSTPTAVASHPNMSAQGLSPIQPKQLYVGESSVDNDNSGRVSPEQSMEKEFELDKNINVVKASNGNKVLHVDRSKIQYAEGDLDSAEEVMEDFSNDSKNTEFSTPVSSGFVGSVSNNYCSQGSLDSLDGHKEYTSCNEDEELYTSAYSNSKLKVPIIGYETMEQRARFTVFKLQVVHSSNDSWFVFRRYTDFVQLSDKLKNISPTFLIPLPPKRWFGDNFDRHFLEDRQRGLQDFIDRILNNKILCECAPVREFFCFDDPPGPHDSLEESRALCESLEEQTYNLKKELKDKEHEIDLLKTELNLCKTQIEGIKRFEKLHINSKSCDIELTSPREPSCGSNNFLNECPEVDQNSFDEQEEPNT